MRYRLRWTGTDTAYVIAESENALMVRRVGHIRRRTDGTWLAHAWPTQLLEPLSSVHDTHEAAANWCADEWERDRPARPPLEGRMPRKFKRSTVEQTSITTTQGATP